MERELEDWKKIRQQTERRRIERQIKAGRRVKIKPSRQPQKIVSAGRHSK